MPADIELGEGDHAEWTTVRGAVLKAETSDVMIDNPARRSGQGGWRRALVHDFQDGLSVNFAGDYPGGVTIADARLNLRYVTQAGLDPQLPSSTLLGVSLPLIQLVV